MCYEGDMIKIEMSTEDFHEFIRGLYAEIAKEQEAAYQRSQWLDDEPNPERRKREQRQVWREFECRVAPIRKQIDCCIKLEAERQFIEQLRNPPFISARPPYPASLP